MQLTVHRGTHTIGGSCAELESRGHRLILDLGMPLMHRDGKPFTFTDHGQAPSQLVTDGVLPAIDNLYADCEQCEKIALLVSHAHQDHWGLARYVHPDVPVYTSEGTISLFRVFDIFLSWLGKAPQAQPLQMWEPVRIGPFTVTAYLADHSAPDATSFLIETENKKVFYSGDLRGHGRKAMVFERLVRNPPKGIDALLLEGTMMSRPGSQEFPDETAVEEALIKVFRDKKRLALIFCSGQNIDRICSIYRAVLRSDSIFVIDLYTAFILDQLRSLSSNIPQFNSDRVRVFHWHSHTEALNKVGRGDFMLQVCRSRIRQDEILERREEICMIARPNSHFGLVTQWIPPDEGMDLIWSMWPGYLTADNPVRQFADTTGERIRQIHTGGHATVEDLQRLATALKPRRLIPMHTLNPEAFQGKFDNVCQLGDCEPMEV